jgi:hypothetical protein
MTSARSECLDKAYSGGREEVSLVFRRQDDRPWLIFDTIILVVRPYQLVIVSIMA